MTRSLNELSRIANKTKWARQVCEVSPSAMCLVPELIMLFGVELLAEMLMLDVMLL